MRFDSNYLRREVTLVPDLKKEADIAQDRNHIIEDNVNLISRVYYKLTGKYLSKSDDEYSIGLSAIDEAIDKYNTHKGASFTSFCHTVIRGRLIDHFRKKRYDIPFSDLETDDNDSSGLAMVEAKQAILNHEDTDRKALLREEITELSLILREYNIEFGQLVENSPKHKDTRESLLKLAKTIVSNSVLMEKVKTKRQLPIKEIELLTGTNRKTLERHRRYIIVLSIILANDFQYLKEYL